VVLAVVDDLLFMSKIKAAATQLGLKVLFARSAPAAVDQMRQAQPSLVILDLSNPRIDTLGIVSTMKADTSLSAIRTVGYASHTHTEMIDAAGRAGVNEVLTRGAFTQRLPEILTPTGA
jgi:PleD family two-component response regulator